MKEKILEAVEEGLAAIEQLGSPQACRFIEEAAHAIASCFEGGGKLLIAGNGGSLCDAMHLAEEFTGFFRAKRPALPAIALADPGHLSCVGNDVGFEQVFARGVEAYGKEGDVFIGLSTSGNSANIVAAFDAAERRGLKTIAFLGAGGKLKGVADLELLIEGFRTSDRVQEAHMAAMHIIIEMVEELLFPGEEARALLEAAAAR